MLSSQRWFPDRGCSPPPESHKVFQGIARRLHRIFAHVFHQHPKVFQEMEVRSPHAGASAGSTGVGSTSTQASRTTVQHA